MAETALQVFNLAEQQLRTGKYAEALASYGRVIVSAPRYWRARFRVGDTLLNLKAPREAMNVYKSLAYYAVKVGQPLHGLVAIKMASLIDPAFHETIDVMAQLYSRDSDRLGDPGQEVTQRSILDGRTPAAPPLTLTGPQLIAQVTQLASDTEAIAQAPVKLPPVPLFSFLDEDAFAGVLAGMQLRRFVKGQALITEGQPGDSFFILADGTVSVTRNIGGKPASLARLHSGAVFGEMALISRAPRTATVTAEEDCEVLELKRATLEAKAHELASVTKALHDFTHERFLANLTATSPIFKPFPKSIRNEIIKKFKDFPVDAGDELIEEGEEGQGLFLIIKGTIEVTKTDEGGQKISLAKLKEGDVFGEISLITDAPTTATCAAIEKGQLFFLPKKDFLSTMARHPEMKAELAKITAERLQKQKEALDPGNLQVIEDDDLIML